MGDDEKSKYFIRILKHMRKNCSPKIFMKNSYSYAWLVASGWWLVAIVAMVLRRKNEN